MSDIEGWENEVGVIREPIEYKHTRGYLWFQVRDSVILSKVV